ncbi:MAG: hypothetical protein ACRCYO_13470 [Bacteroidia bacterium]
MFDIFKHDFWAILLKSRSEIAGLKLALNEGRVNGSTYEGPCACLVGTIANVKGCHHKELEVITPDSGRPAERWFMLIGEEMKPDNSEVVKLTIEWIEEFEFFVK